MAPKKTFDRSIFEVYFGYRSLLDWSTSSNWQRGASATFGTQKRNLSGPHTFPPQSARQRLNFWGQNKTSAKIPGSAGTFFDVMFNTPSGSTPGGVWDAAKGDDIEATSQAMMADLGEHAQQWLYLAAENMAAKGKKLMSKGKITEDELKRLSILLDIEEDYVDSDSTTRQAAIEAMTDGEWHAESEEGAAHMAANAANFQMAGVLRHEDTGKEVRVGSSVQASKKDYGLRQSGIAMAKGVGATPSGFSSHKISEKDTHGWLATKPTAGEKQFRSMLLGVRGQWIDLFAQSVIDVVGERGIKTLSAKVHKVMVKRGIQYHPKGREIDFVPSKFDPEVTGAAGGQTPQELAIIRATGKGGKSIATGKYGQHGFGHGIDVKFEKYVALPLKKIGKGRKKFKKADLTTSFFREGKHHGIGKVGKRGLPVESTIAQSEAWVRKEYNKNRIPKYNALIDFIMKATDRSTLKGSTLNRAQIWSARQDWNKLTSEQRSGHIKTLAASAIYDGVANTLSKDLEWVLHHMANMLPGGIHDPDPYAMTAPFLISEATDTKAADIGTIFIVFDIKPDGTYKNMDMDPSDGINGSYVYIDTRSPMKWLYDKAVAEGYKGSLFEFANMGSIATASETLNAVRTSGVLFEHLSNTGKRINQHLSYSKLSTPEVAQTLREVTDDFFKEFAEGTEKMLSQQLHDDAVKYSLHARNPGTLEEINKWYDFGVSYLMTRKQADARLNDIHDVTNIAALRGNKAETKRIWKEQFGSGKGLKAGDPYWYLWAAPYISRKRVEVGGAQTGFLYDPSEE